MRTLIIRWPVRLGCILLAVMLLSGCTAGLSAFKDGEKALMKGRYDQAVAALLIAVEKDPQSYKYQLKLEYARERASLAHSRSGERFFNQKSYHRAQEEYQLAADLAGSNFSAIEGLKQTRKYLQAQKLTEDAAALLKARRHLQAKELLAQAINLVNDFQPALKLREKMQQTQYTVIDGVELEVTSDQPITLNFTDAKLPDVFDILSSLSGINFILDEDVRGENTTLFLERATFAQALELLLRMNKLDKKVLNSKTIILFPKTRDKQKQFEDQLIHTFYLSNIDAKKAVNLLRTMLQVRKIYVNEGLNAIVIRDTPAVIKLAQKILEANDRSNSEVIFDLELIEVNHTDNRELGLKLSNYSIGAGLAIPGAAAIASSGLKAGDSVSGLIDGINGFKELTPFYSIPTATFRLMKTLVDAEVLANPKIRVKNKEKAKVHIGSREPIITVTTSGTDTVTESVQYVDVGVKLEVEPTIQLDNTIVTKLGLEVSNVSGRETTSNGTAVITISTTNANTVLTLKDGEQTIIGGLIRGDKSTTKNKIPFLGDIPLLGELFNATNKTHNKREILLSITPHIVKSISLPEQDVANIWSGGEDDLKYGRNFGSFRDEYIAGQKGLEPQAERQPQPVAGAETTAVTAAPPLPGTPPAELPATVGLAEEPVKATAAATAPKPEVTGTPETAALTVKKEPVTEEVLAAATPVSTLKPMIFVKGPELVKVGEQFTLTFYVDEITDLFSAPLYVKYDKDLFEFLGAAEGTFLKQGRNPTIFTHTALLGSGRIIVGLKQGAGGDGISGGGELFTMNFKALAAGTGVIEPTRTNFRNPQGVRLKVDSRGLNIEVER